MLSTTEVAALARTTRHTVSREIERGNLQAEKVGRTWVVQPDEARRWAAQFTPYSALRKGTDAAPTGTPRTAG